MSNGEQNLLDLLNKAHACNAECITVEYKDMEYFIDAETGNKGIGIDRINAQEKSSELLIQSIYNLKRKRRRTIESSGCKYKIRIETYEDFGEQAYRIWFKKQS